MCGTYHLVVVFFQVQHSDVSHFLCQHIGQSPPALCHSNVKESVRQRRTHWPGEYLIALSTPMSCPQCTWSKQPMMPVGQVHYLFRYLVFY